MRWLVKNRVCITRWRHRTTCSAHCWGTNVVMTLAESINILIIKVNKSFSFFSLRCFLKEIENMYMYCTPYFYRVIQTWVEVLENSKKLWKHSPAARVPTAFLVLPNFHSCLYNSIETRYMFLFLKYSICLNEQHIYLLKVSYLASRLPWYKLLQQKASWCCGVWQVSSSQHQTL